MQKNDGFGFDEWFDALALRISDATGITFTDREDVQTDYDNNAVMEDVADEIIDEYQ